MSTEDLTLDPLFSLGGESGALMARTDWASTPLGRPSCWPQSLRTAAGLCVESRFPMLVMWGRELVMIYNEAFRPILGAKHPRSMGQQGAECWAEAWDQVGPMLTGVLDTGAPVYAEDLLVVLERAGQSEDCYFTFCYSPIRAEDGAVGGVLVTVFETTDRVVGDRRLRCLRDLAEARADAISTDDVLARAADVLRRFPSEAPFGCLYRIDESGEVAESAFVGLAAPVAGAAWPIRDVIERRRAVEVTQLPGEAAAAWAAADAPDRAIAIPVSGAVTSEIAGVVVLGLNPRQVVDAGYRSFLDLVAESLAAGLASAGAREQERQRAEALGALDRAKTALLTNVSHEFRTPLTLMLGPLEEMIADARDSPDLLARLEGVRHNGERLLRLVNSLLDFTRLQAGEVAPALVGVDLGPLTFQIASSFAQVCERAGIALVLDCPSAIGDVDVEMWETIVLNLISNAFKFTVTGAITVRTASVAPAHVALTVTDTGAGIAEQEMPRLTERFYRAANTSGRSAEGSGLGLALVRNLVELHGGDLSIDSQVGRGTTVTVQVPAHPASGAASVARGPGLPRTGTDNAYVAEAGEWLAGDESAGPARTEAAPGDRPLVLVADDNAGMRTYLERVLRRRWNVLAVSNGQIALSAVRALKPDLIVTDVMMPALDGFALVEAIRSDPELATLPVIMLSARAGAESAGEGFAAGSDDYLIKPFAADDLINRTEARLAAGARARTQSEREGQRADRAAALADLSTRLSAAASVPEMLTELLAVPDTSLGATVVALAAVDAGRGSLRVQYAGALPSEFHDRYHVLAHDAPVPIAEVIRTGERMVIGDTLELDERFEAVVRDAAGAARAALIEPLRGAGGELIGGLALAWPDPRRFDDRETVLAAEVANAAALTLERIQLTEQEHRVATALQERLLALEVSSPSAVISARYEPAREAMRVGGDWYTATALDDGGRVAISAGDVVGSGLEGATVMSQLRSALAAAALTSADPGAVLDLLDRYAARVPGASCATVAYAVVEPATASVEYACAGHPYPLLVRADGTVEYLKDGRRPPLAAYPSGPTSPPGRSELPAGSLLVLYTDGLFERRGESIDVGLERLAHAAAHCALMPAGDVCSELLARMIPDAGYPDDVAIVAVRPAGRTARAFVEAIPAKIEELAPLRAHFRDWLRSGHAMSSPKAEHNAVLAVAEALNNALEHGSGFDPRRIVSLEAFTVAGGISATVSDTGQWKSDSAASRRGSARGHGLTIVHGLSDDVTTVRSILGTRVTMRFAADR